jgi:RNA polymerase sigma-70 factor (ECF subfamily)
MTTRIDPMPSPLSPKTDVGVDSSAGLGPFPIGTGAPGSGRGDATREVSDEELVQRMREGEAAAAETLCRRYHQALFRYLQRIGGNEHIAEELHQQTWVSVLEHLDRFDPSSSPGGFKAWLFRIATNKGNDLWRSRGREKATKESLKRIVDQTSPEASAPMEGGEQVERLRREIERLPEPQRKVLMLRYYSGMKFVEIAQILGCPLNTALGRMHKAILKLRSAMES